MPLLGGATEWLNSEPLGPAELRGRVVLVDFWTLTCINWLRTAPYVRTWAKAYRDDGLVVIGVHTPEFSFEHDVDLVRSATAERGIDHAVVVDNDYAVWSAFDNHYWPARYTVDEDGLIRDHQFGEGDYERSELLLQRLLGLDRDLVLVEKVGIEAAADWQHLRTPETYLGYSRGERFSSPGGVVPDERRDHELPARLRTGHWALSGEWTVGQENVRLEHGGGSVAFRFVARDAHAVLSQTGSEPIAFRVRLDGEAPGPDHGLDIDADGNGLLRSGRLYQLVRQDREVHKRTLEITFAAAGAEAYAFTFG
jgi:thiol-disulfide isomerase/thioredoxin